MTGRSREVRSADGEQCEAPPLLQLQVVLHSSCTAVVPLSVWPRASVHPDVGVPRGLCPPIRVCLAQYVLRQSVI